ncbi:MAG: type II toxin-antitoxin system VapB family antitoxin [Herbiconiux sp.]|nr:type II toxin-antitoxin system VapB family antitoxin [Herbiconiux sp.]
MAITSIDIDRELLHEAKQLLGAGSNREAVQRALQYTVTMQRQRLALERISHREFSAEQVDAPKLDH